MSPKTCVTDWDCCEGTVRYGPRDRLLPCRGASGSGASGSGAYGSALVTHTGIDLDAVSLVLVSCCLRDAF